MSTGAGTIWTLASLAGGLGSLGNLVLGLGAMVVLIAALALWRRRLQDRAAGGARSAWPWGRGNGRADQRERAGAAGLAADMQELTDRLAALLDERAARLELLIETADERLSRLEAHAATPAPQAPSRTSPQRAPAPEPRRRDPLSWHDDRDPINREVYRLADGGLPTVEIAKRLDEQIGKVELILALREQ